MDKIQKRSRRRSMITTTPQSPSLSIFPNPTNSNCNPIKHRHSMHVSLRKFCCLVGVTVVVLAVIFSTMRFLLASTTNDHAIAATSASSNRILLPFLASIWNSTTETTPIVPVYWHIPKAGGTSMKLWIQCLELISVDEGPGGVNKNTGLVQIVQTQERRAHVNVEISTHSGIVNARDRGFVDFMVTRSNALSKQQGVSGSTTTSPPVLDMVLTTPFLQDAIHYLLPEPPVNVKALLLGVFRHPVERAESLFYYLQKAHWETTYRPDLINTSILEFYSNASNTFERNWMTYYLSFQGRTDRNSQLPQWVTREDLDYAKKMVEEYMLVGLTDRMEETLERMGWYIGWHELPNWNDCKRQDANANAHPRVQPGSPEWKAIADVNVFDMELYEHALQVFEKQAVLFETMKK